MIGAIFKSMLTMILVSFVLVVAAIFAMPYLVPQNIIKSEIKQVVKKKTGKNLEIDGKVSLSIFPNISIFMTNARISDGDGKNEHKISELNAKFDLTSLIGNDLDFTLKTVLDGDTFGAGIDIEDVKSLYAGKESDVSINLSLPKISDSEGNVVLPEPLRPSLGFKLSLIENKKAILNDINFSVGSSKAEGKLEITKIGERNSISGKIAFGNLDVEEVVRVIAAVGYVLQEVTSADGEKALKASKAYISNKYNWSDEPLNLAMLKSFDVDLAINAESIKTGSVVLGKTTLNAKLKGGVLNIDIPQVQLYGGSGTGKSTIDASGAVSKISKEVNFKNIELGSFLKDISDIERLDGVGDLKFSISSSGDSELDIIKNLNGNGSFNINGGNLKGIDIISMADYAQSIIDKAVNSEGKNTELKTASASFAIINGVMKNNDLKVQLPFSELSGQGELNLENFMIKYRVTPNVGMGGVGLKVPLVIDGDIRKPSVKPDTKAIVTQGVDKLLKENKEAQKLKGKLDEIQQKLQNNLFPAIVAPSPEADNKEQNQSIESNVPVTVPAE